MSRTLSRGTLCLAAAALLLSAGCKEDKKRHKLPATAIPAGAPQGGKAASADTAKSDTAKAKAAKAPVGHLRPLAGVALLNGTTKAARTTQPAPRVSGLVKKVAFKEGDIVEKGQLLVQLDRTDFLLQLRQAKAARDVAQAGLNAVKVEWKRLRGLLRAKAIPSGQFDKVDSQFKVAQAQLAQAKVAIAAAKVMLGKTSIRAPFRAVVTRKMTEVGVYATMMPPSPVGVLEEIDPLEVVIQVPEAQLAQVQKGTPVQLHFSAIGLKLQTRVDRVVASLNAQTRSFSAYVVLPNAKHKLRPGMFVEARLLAGETAPAKGGAK